MPLQPLLHEILPLLAERLTALGSAPEVHPAALIEKKGK